MKTKLTLKVATALLSLSALIYQTPTTFAQGTAFTYQGLLNDGASPANGSYDLTFALFGVNSGAGQIGSTITNTATPVSNGLFTVSLDFGANFPGADRWLEIAVRTNSGGAFTTLIPRTKATAAPYAITASNLSGTLPASKLTGTIAAANIANGSLTGAMLANGAVTSNHLAAAAVTTTALADGAVTGAKIFSSFNILSTIVFTNPTPLALDQFGFAVAAVGTDKILVGAYLDDAGSNNAGAAHLFDSAGHLLVTLTNPTPSADDNFGYAVSAVGTDKLLVGAYLDDTGALNAGSAYLFSTGGALLLTLTNPSPAVADGFGFSVAAVGLGNFLIGSFHDNPGGGQFGAAHLYDLAGNLVQTFTNPTPANLDGFGTAVAGVGTDKVLIGASSDDTGANNAGAAYLFDTNGTLLTTFTNPTPVASDAFGTAVAAVGTDKILISAPADDTGATDAGAAYLYDLNGNLLTTFTNPAPASSDQFGRSLTAVGASHVLIGAPIDDAGAANAGTAYLFDLSGKLLFTFTNPAPATSDQFGSALAALDANRVIIGAQQDDLGVNDAGGAYLIALDTFTPGLVADSVRFGGVDSASIAAGAVASTQLADGAVGANQLATGAVMTGALADGAVTATKVATVSNWFALTIANPTPASFDRFGYSVAAVGSDRVLIGALYDDTGADDAGAAYLFSTNGTLLTTFPNPIPTSSDLFGISLAAVGSDRVLIGKYASSAAAYLFSINGTLLTTFTNPTPASGDLFGSSLAAVGSDRVLIGAGGDDTGAALAGAAYLFSTNGTLLTTFTNPTPAVNDQFGGSVAAVGNDRVLIGARLDDTGADGAGAAYLFSINGTLLTTFTNPTPAVTDIFGISVAAVGSDRVLIAATGDDTGATDTGAAYLFSTNGTLLTTFTNPTPASGDQFGRSVAAVGSDRVLIGAYGDDTGASDAGAVYLFSTNGTLLTTFTNPTPGGGDFFGNSVAALGSDRVLIAATGDDTGASEAGAAYLFSTESFTDGLVADAVRARSVTTASLEDGAVTLAKLDPTIGVWTRSGDNVFRLEGNVGIGTTTPATALHVRGLSGNVEISVQSNDAGGHRWALLSSGVSGAATDASFQIIDRTSGGSRLFIGTNGLVGIGTSAPTNKLHVVGGVSATTFVTTSDRNAKENFTAISPSEVLAKVASLPITKWNFKELKDGQHLGPMAQDFFAAFGLGGGETTITTVDADGVALAAIQGLNQKVEAGSQRGEVRNRILEERLQQKETEITELKTRLEVLEKIIRNRKSN